MLLTVTVTGQRKRSVTYHPGGIRGSRLLHARFTEEYMRALFEGTGLVNFAFDQFMPSGMDAISISSSLLVL